MFLNLNPVLSTCESEGCRDGVDKFNCNFIFNQ